MIASSLFRPRNRATTVTPLGPLSQIDEPLFPGRTSWAGVEVSQSSALTLPAFLQGIRTVAQDVALLEFHVYERLADGGKRRAPESPFWKLVHDRPNPWQSSQQFRECMTGLAMLRGGSLALPTVVKGTVKELLPLRPGSWKVEQMSDFSLVYKVNNDGGGQTPYTRDDVFHIAGFGLDGVNGLGLLSLGREALGEAQAQTHYSASSFANDATPSGYLKSSGPLTKTQAQDLRDNWEELHGGIDNRHRVAVLPHDLSWQSVGMTNEAAKLIESRQFTVLDMARLIGIPPHKLYELGRATWGNVEQMGIDYFLAIQSWVKRWENETNERVIRKETHFAEMLPETILRLDSETQTKIIAQRVNNALMTPNEGRKVLNLPAIAGGDTLLVPVNLAPLGAEPPAAPPAARASALLASLTSSLGRLAAQPEPRALVAATFADPRVEQSFTAAVHALRDRGKAAHQITVVEMASQMGYSRTALHDLMKADGVDFGAKVAAILTE
jgi:HK97 family phage portal protein